MFLLLSFEWSRSSIVFFMGDEPQRYPIKQGSRKFLICGKRRNRDRPMPQSGSQCDKRIPTRQRQCLTCSTRWVLRMTWLCLTISEEFVSKYTVFSHKGGVRTLADNTRTRMRVLFYMVICASVFAENWGWRSATERTPSIAPEESPLWGLSAIHRTKYCPLVPLAWFSMSRLPKHFCAPWSQYLPCRCFSLFIAPEWYSGAFSRKSTFLKIFLLIYPSYTLPSSAERRAGEDRENNDSTPRQQKVTKPEKGWLDYWYIILKNVLFWLVSWKGWLES